MSEYVVVIDTNELGTGNAVDAAIVSMRDRNGAREVMIVIASPDEYAAQTMLTVETCDRLIDALKEARGFLTGDEYPGSTPTKRTLEHDGPVPPKMTTVERQAYTRTIAELTQRQNDARTIAATMPGGVFATLLNAATAEAFGIAADAVRAHRDRRDQRR